MKIGDKTFKVWDSQTQIVMFVLGNHLKAETLSKVHILTRHSKE